MLIVFLIVCISVAISRTLKPEIKVFIFNAFLVNVIIGTSSLMSSLLNNDVLIEEVNLYFFQYAK